VRGSMIRHLAWISIDLVRINGSDRNTSSIRGRREGMRVIIWWTSVAITRDASLRRPELRQQKKDAKNRHSCAKRFAMVRAMADFPAPAAPFIHLREKAGQRSWTQRIMVSMTKVRVPGWHTPWSSTSPESCIASGTMRS